MRASPSYAVFTVTFAAVFSVVYVFAVEYNWALFSYAPATGTFAPLATSAGEHRTAACCVLSSGLLQLTRKPPFGLGPLPSNRR